MEYYLATVPELLAKIYTPLSENHQYSVICSRVILSEKYAEDEAFSVVDYDDPPVFRVNKNLSKETPHDLYKQELTAHIQKLFQNMNTEHPLNHDLEVKDEYPKSPTLSQSSLRNNSTELSEAEFNQKNIRDERPPDEIKNALDLMGFAPSECDSNDMGLRVKYYKKKKQLSRSKRVYFLQNRLKRNLTDEPSDSRTINDIQVAAFSETLPSDNICNERNVEVTNIPLSCINGSENNSDVTNLSVTSEISNSVDKDDTNVTSLFVTPPTPTKCFDNNQQTADRAMNFLSSTPFGTASENSNNEDEQFESCLEQEMYYSAKDEFSPPKKKKRKKNKKAKETSFDSIQGNWKLRKYWFNRFSLFSKYDEGITLDEESWYSVTPEKIARHIADRCRCDVIVDAFCGAGGNAIQFAMTCERVIAVDIDPNKIKLAKHNASVYGVEDRIEFIVADFYTISEMLKADVVFLSPPWGGPSYLNAKTTSLAKIMESRGGGQRMFDIAKAISQNISIYLPRNIDMNEVMKLPGPGGSLEMEQSILGDKLKAITIYYSPESYFDVDA